MACCVSTGGILSYRGNNLNTPSASLSLLTGSRTATSLSLNAKPISSGSLHSAFTPSSLSLSSASSFSAVRASRFRLCQTKRNRSRKSLARTHGFRTRMSTTSGRAVIKHRRAKGRWAFCTKTSPNSGKRA